MSMQRAGNPPVICANLSVKDEAALIEPAIRHLRAIGVDYILACDISSSDGTAEILERHRSDTFQAFTLRDVGEDWSQENLLRYARLPVDWVMFLDADEFWIPASGNLKDCAALRNADVVSVDRFNVPVGPDGPWLPEAAMKDHLDEVRLVVRKIPDFRRHLQRHPATPWIYSSIGPKVMARREIIGSVVQGAHDIVGTRDSVRRVGATDLLIAHVPLSTRDRFARKVANIVATFKAENVDVLTGPDTWHNNSLGWHWRRWAELAAHGLLDEEYDRNVFDAAAVARLEREGAIRTAAEVFASGPLGMGPAWSG